MFDYQTSKHAHFDAASCAVMMNTDYDEYLIADVNPDLVNLYKAMAYHTDALLNELEILFTHGRNNGRNWYQPDELADPACDWCHCAAGCRLLSAG